MKTVWLLLAASAAFAAFGGSVGVYSPTVVDTNLEQGVWRKYELAALCPLTAARVQALNDMTVEDSVILGGNWTKLQVDTLPASIPEHPEYGVEDQFFHNVTIRCATSNIPLPAARNSLLFLNSSGPLPAASSTSRLFAPAQFDAVIDTDSLTPVEAYHDLWYHGFHRRKR